jgi:4-alpha-glucanotransferase
VTDLGVLAEIIKRPVSELGDLKNMYLDTYHEKEKLWKKLGCSGKMREHSDRAIIRAVFDQTMQSASIFCIETIVDWLFLGELMGSDTYEKRINTPGTVRSENWSLIMPLSLEELIRHKLTATMKKIIKNAAR